MWVFYCTAFDRRRLVFSIIICSSLLIGWKHILVQLPSPISSVKVIAWQTAWLNKECRDQVILLPGFDYTFFFFSLWPCSCVFSHYDFELFSFLFCRGLFSFELIRMAILRFSLLLFFLYCALSYLWPFAIVRYCVVSVLLPPGFGV